MGSSRLVNRNIVSLRGRTSMRLEPELWDALHEICGRERITLGALIQSIEQSDQPGARTSAVRVHVLRYFRQAGTAEGHANARHGPSPAERVAFDAWRNQRRIATV